MGLLTPEQIRELRIYLENEGLTDESLQTEMLDHFCCDVEEYLEQGFAFDEAIQNLHSQIPNNQFKIIQTETMEVLNKKIKPSVVSAYASFTLLVAATGFKLMHWPGAGQILMLSFGGLAITLLLSLFTNPLIKQKDKGRVALFALVTVVLIFITSLVFQSLHLPGTTFLRQTSVILSIALLSIYAVFSYFNPEKVSDHLIMDYVKKDGIRIEWFLILLLVFGASLTLWQNDFVFMIFFMLLFSFGGVFYFISSWQYYSNEMAKPVMKLTILLVSILTYAMFMVPTMRIIEEPLRIIFIWGAFVIVSLTISLYYFINSTDKKKYLLGLFSLMITFLTATNLIAKTGITNQETSQTLLSMIYNPIIFICLLVAFIAFFKKPVFRALLIMTLAMLFASHQLPGI